MREIQSNFRSNAETIVNYRALLFSCVIVFTAVLALMPHGANAQYRDDAGPWIGAGGGYAIYLQSIASPGVVPITGTNCAPFTNGNGGGAVGALSLDWRFPSAYSILVRAAFSPSSVTMNGQLAATTKDATGNIVPLELQEVMTVKSTNISLEILPEIHSEQLKAMLGATVLLNSAMTWGVQSTIATPTNVTFNNGFRTNQLLPQSSVPNSRTLLIGVTGGVGLELPLSAKLTLSPEATGTYFLNSMKGDISWKQTAFTFLASIRYHLGCNIPGKRHHAINMDTLRVNHINPLGIAFMQGTAHSILELTTGECQPDTLETFRRTDTLYKTCPPLAANVQMFGIDEDGRQSLSNLRKIHVEMEYVLDKIPLLPYIFFDSGSASIPTRYRQVASGTDLSHSTSVELNHQLLAIVAARLLKSSSGKIVIRGFVDSTELGANGRLGAARARAVTAYFVDQLDVSPKKIQIDSSSDRLPLVATISELSAGRAEDRRVEILSNSPEILSPEDQDSILEPGVIDPSAVIIRTEGSSTAGITRSISTVQLQGKVLFDSAQAVLPAPHTFQITPALATNAQNRDQLKSTLTLRDECNFSQSAVANAVIEKDTSKYSVRRFTLVNFRIGSAELSPQDTAKLHSFFMGLTPEDQISVKGYTDYLGNSAENMELSKQRADAIVSYWGRSWRKGNIISKYGVGDREFVFGISSYDLPEERFLSRTVVIEVKHRQ
jgi:outer membrane protein OmpA-like peptidoglycan-associated protein